MSSRAEWTDLDSPALWACVLLASITGLVACVLALFGLKFKPARLNLSAMIVGGVSRGSHRLSEES
jgi:uncharacterized membrane protein YphA (DoxX/SURF4 family)